MTALFSFLLAATLTMSTPSTSPAGWALESDYPASAKQRKETGSVEFLLVTSPQGRVSQCQIMQSSGSSELDQRTCEVMYARASFKPATDENENPTSGFYKGRFTWTLPGQPRQPTARKPERPADILLQVKALPNKAKEIVVGIRTRIDENGKVAVCEPLDDAPDRLKLANVACAQAKALNLSTIKDDAGNPIPMIRTFGVSFKTNNQ
ncbi:MAG: energy transducer TonB [Sphingobium sp.]|nr:energy transducer TonB [Sphingobium sp.]